MTGDVINIHYTTIEVLIEAPFEYAPKLGVSSVLFNQSPFVNTFYFMSF